MQLCNVKSYSEIKFRLCEGLIYFTYFYSFSFKKGPFMRRIALFLLFTGQINSCFSQAINYKDLFGDDWKKAEIFEKENRTWMEKLLTENYISYPLAVAVIFPELVRYSALRDKMEITLLKALYINLGNNYANFSIGRFQMKPSFAESIIEQSPAVTDHKSGPTLKSKENFEDIINFRKSVVTDLEDPKTQINYLILFLKICEKKYKLNREDEISRLKFLATAYNCGINKNAEEIENMTDKKFFNTRLFKTENYSYADVSVFWYKQYMENR